MLVYHLVQMIHVHKSIFYFFFKAQEIRAYLRSCGADIKEESTTPLHEDLDQLLSACDITFKNESGDCYNNDDDYYNNDDTCINKAVPFFIYVFCSRWRL